MTDWVTSTLEFWPKEWLLKLETLQTKRQQQKRQKKQKKTKDKDKKRVWYCDVSAVLHSCYWCIDHNEGDLLRIILVIPHLPRPICPGRLSNSQPLVCWSKFSFLDIHFSRPCSKNTFLNAHLSSSPLKIFISQWVFWFVLRGKSKLASQILIEWEKGRPMCPAYLCGTTWWPNLKPTQLTPPRAIQEIMFFCPSKICGKRA